LPSAHDPVSDVNAKIMTDKRWISANGRSSVCGSLTNVATNPVHAGESGILRKTLGYAQENFDDLLVFGYSCKIFRDDFKAQEIDQGKHLIPWMGDHSLKIDRLIVFFNSIILI
jgi:hypothetical protein